MDKLKNRSGVYVIRNLVNNKVYIGSSIDLKQRANSHFNNNGINKYHNRYLNRAFQKYGVDNFKFEVLMYCNKEDLITNEDRYIKLFEVYNKDIGYNISPNAGNCLGVKHTEETRKKISEKTKGEKNPMYNIRLVGEKNPFYGKTHTKETMDKIIKKTSKPVVQINKDTGEFIAEFINRADAMEKTGIYKISINHCCRGAYKTAGGFRWFFKSDYEKSNGNIPELEANKTTAKAVIKLTLDGKFIEKYNSITEASKNTNISISNISKCCRGKTKTSCGFKWMFAEKYYSQFNNSNML